MIDNRAVGKTIATLRQNRNMTQQQLAATLSVSHQAVSKWENGAALPDVQTLMEISRLFGITMEQLLSGEIPPERLENKSPLEEPIRDIGNFFNNIVNGIFQTPKTEDGDEEDDGAEDATPKEEEPSAEPEALDLEKLLQMAPFMSKAAVDQLLLEHRSQLTASDIAKFAPFMSRECLEKLIQNPETEITWETLQRIAPFLKREMVDRLARLAAKGNRIAQDAAANPGGCGEDIGRAIGDMSQTIGKGVEKMARKAGKLSEEEYEAIRQHPTVGNQILSKITVADYLSIGAHYHHERIDGKGYPDGLKGDDIPDIARIIAVADAYDAMTSKRSYREVLPQEAVRDEIIKGLGTQFDNTYGRIMLKMMAEDIEYRMRESDEDMPQD